MKKLLYNKFMFIVILAAAICFGQAVFTCNSAYAADPVLFFSDLTWGPKTGWETSTTKGAAVTIWGKNFGSTRGSNYVTVNGAQLTSDADYAEWGASGPARGLARITFWLNSSCTDGSGTISVTTSEGTSNTLPFNVTTGTIYFISVTAGSNSNNGRYASAQGGANGPFRDLYMFNPGLDSSHNSSNRNPSGDGQYIAYVRGGTYTSQDTDSAAIALRGPYGGATLQKALIGYPGESVWVDTTSMTRGIAWHASYDPYGKCDYFTFSKINGHSGQAPWGVYGDYNRIVGGEYYGYTTYAQTGDIQVTNSQRTAIYGNYFHDNGNDSMKHGVYVKTEYTGQTSGDRSTQYTDIGWNEFANYLASDNHGGVIFVSKSGDSQIQSYPTAYTYIHNNYFHNNNQECLYVGDGVAIGDVYFYNNICGPLASTTTNGGMTFNNGTNNAYVYNNTFYQIAGAASTEWWATGTATRVYTVNNIFYATSGKSFVSVENYYGATVNSQYDLYYSPTGASLPSGSGITVSNYRSGDPLFVTNGSNFQLQSGSPARDTGTSSVSSIVTADYDGISRPQGSAYDIGAYEYDTGSPPPTTWIVTTSVSGGNGSLSCNSPVVDGNTTTCTATPNSGYYTSSLSGCGGTWSSGNSYTTGAITANCTVTAQFTSSTTTYTVTPSAGANGSISPSSPQTVAQGATTQFTVTPANGYAASVGGTCGGTLVGTTYTTNAITSNCTVAATFSQITHTVTPSAGANGSISPSSPQTVNDGATTTFTVTPNSGYTAAVGGTCGGYLSGTTYTTNTITANCTVSATFVSGTRIPSTPTGVSAN